MGSPFEDPAMRNSILTSLLLLLPPGHAMAQAAKTLGAPTATIPFEFAHIAGVRELPNGTVLVSDDRDRLVVLIDFTAQTARRLGRDGAGPAEYARPGTLLAIAGGATLLLDPGNARFLEFGPDGAIRGTVSPSRRGSGVQSNHMLALSAAWDARGTDEAGHIYFEQLPGPLRPGESRQVPIVRWDHRSGSLDTVGTYVLADTMLTLAPEVHGKEAIIRPRAWPTRPQWSVAPDGRIALVQASPYRVSWLAGAGRSAGPSVPYLPLRVTAEDKAAFLEEIRGARSSSRPSPSGESRPPGGRPPLRKTEGEPLFPDTKPPFSGREAVRVGADGTVWVARTRNAEDPVIRYDRFDRSAIQIGQVVFPAATRLVGFGRGSLYLARRDADDLEHLERFEIPK